MVKILIAGSGTDVGKTITAAVVTSCLNGEYWKPIQTGSDQIDTVIMQSLIDPIKHPIHPPAYSLKEPLSPHHAARLENIEICPDCIVPPLTVKPLIIESVGGVLVPLTPSELSLSLFKKWQAKWIVVCRHYLGSINHTLLTLEVLKQQAIFVAGIIFNGYPNPDSEKIILSFSQLPLLGRLLPEKKINQQIIQKYAAQWQPNLVQALY